MAISSSGATPSESVYMCFGSVTGEASAALTIPKAPASGGWIKLTSCSFSGRVGNPQMSEAQTDFEGEIPPVVVTKQTDASSVGLLREALMGNFDKPVVIVFVRTGSHGPQEYIRLEMSGCGIVEFGMDGAGDRQTETYSIRCETMNITTWHFTGTTRGAQAVAIISNEARGR